MQLQRIKGVETHCKWTPLCHHKGWALGDSTVPGHTAWACSECMGGDVDQRRESAHRRRRSTRRGGGGEGGGSQIFSPQPPTGHRCFCRVLWVTSTAQLSTGTRCNWSLLPSKSKHPRTGLGIRRVNRMEARLRWDHDHLFRRNRESDLDAKRAIRRNKRRMWGRDRSAWACWRYRPREW